MPLLSDRRGFSSGDDNAVFENLIAGDALIANARRVVLGVYEALAAFGAAEEIGHIAVEEALLLPVGRAAVCQCVDIGAAWNSCEFWIARQSSIFAVSSALRGRSPGSKSVR